MTSPSEPPKTVKSCENTHTRRPSIVPWPVTTASPQGRVLVHLELVRAVADVGVELLERARVEQLLDPLAGRVLALGVLLLDRRLGARGGSRPRAARCELRELLLVRLEGFLAHRRAQSMARSAAARTHSSVTAGRGPSASRTSTRSASAGLAPARAAAARTVPRASLTVIERVPDGERHDQHAVAIQPRCSPRQPPDARGRAQPAPRPPRPGLERRRQQQPHRGEVGRARGGGDREPHGRPARAQPSIEPLRQRRRRAADDAPAWRSPPCARPSAR